MKKVLIVLFSILLLAGFVTCSGDVDNNLFEKTVTYVAGSGEGKPIVRNTVGGCHEILPNSLLEIPKEEPPQQRKLLASTSEADYAGYYKKNFSFYGWADQDGKYYVYNPDSTKNSVKFTKNVTLEALWRNDISGEVITNSEYAKITAYSGSGADTLILPKVITIWDDKGNHTDYLVSTIDTGAIADDTLKTVILPDSITEIKEFAFTNCKNLATVEMKSETPPTVDINALPKSTKIQVSDDLEYPETLGGFTVEEKTEQTPVEVSTHVTGVTLSPSEVSLVIETERQLSYSITPGNATNQKVTFTSSNKSVATVDDEGLVKAVAAGTATITVKTDDGKIEAPCSVTVVETTVPVTRITLDNTKTITSGESISLTANVSPTNATDKRISWSSSDSTIARVDSNGKVTGLQAGTAVITATSVSDNTKTASCNITVNNTVKGIYSISYELQSGTAPTSANPTSYTTGTGVASFNDPTRTGYTFNGWYDAATGGNKITSISTTDTGAKILYAQWIAKTYTVTLNSDSPTTAFTALTTYTYGVGATLPTDGAKTGYTFSGWYAKSDFSGDAVTTISTTDTENKEFWAKWTAKTYTVTLNTNSPTTAFTALTTYTYGVGATLPTDGAKTGYTFSGWYTDSKFSGNAVTVISTTDTENKEFWVKWTANTYKLKFDGNGNTNTSVSMSDQELTYGAASTAITANAFEKTGYTFAGWSTVKDGAVVYADKASVQNLSSTNNDSITLYAKWTPNEYSITYKDQGNTTFTGTHGSNYPTKHTYATATTLVDPTKTGYTFGGWYTSSDCSDTTKVTTLTATGYTADITLYAKWTVNTYKIAFDKNGGSGNTMNEIDCTYGTPRNLTQNTYTRTDYTFLGWTTSTDGSGTVYTDQQSVQNLTSEANATVTLYAKWGAHHSISINYNYANEPHPTNPTYYVEGIGADLSTFNKPTRDGYYFKGWYISNETEITNIPTTANTDITFFAFWLLTHAININYNYADTPYPDNPTYYAEQIGADLSTFNKPTRAGYTFRGWYINNETEITNIPTTANTDITFYAFWDPNNYTVKFNGNGNTNTASMSDIVCTYDTATNLPPNAFEKTGYAFAGWTISTDGSGTVYTDQQSVQNLTSEANATVTLYAKWTASTYTITYKDKDDVTFSGTHGDNHPTTHTYDTATTLVEPTKTGYTFGGWYTNSGCTDATKVTSLTATGYTGNITLYAKWTAHTYTVKFNGNGNTNTATMSDIACSYDTAVNLTSNAFEKTGYVFLGWTTSTDGSGTVYTDQQSVQNLTSEDNATVTLYAKWALPTKGTASTSDTNRPSYSGINNACDWVQLWKDGPKWATMNIGSTVTNYVNATGNSTANVGGLYSWGGSNEKREGTKTDDSYNSNGNIQGTANDTAKKLWGDNWVMPTEDQLKELIDNCTWTWCSGASGSQYVTGCTLAGYKVSGKGDYSDNSIFLPAAGYYNPSLNPSYGGIKEQGTKGYYWSSTPGNIESCASLLLFSSDSESVNGGYGRNSGFSVRAILK